MKQGKQMTLKFLLGTVLLVAGHSAFAADSQCPDGQFNPYQTVCMCPGGGYVGPGERCNRGDGGGGVVILPVPKTWGSIAIDMSKAQSKAGFATSEKSQAEANQKALARCKLSTCEVALTFQNSCGAIAAGERGRGIWGGAINVNEAKAMQQAADACYDKGAKDCYKWVTPKCAAAPR